MLKRRFSQILLIAIVEKGTDDPDATYDKNDETKATKEKKKTITEKKDFSPFVTATIEDIVPKTDKSNSKYLLLTLDQLFNNVFVFPYKVSEETWDNLQIGSRYQFVLEEREKGLLVLMMNKK